MKTERNLIRYEYELEDDCWCVWRDDKVLCRFTDHYISALAADYKIDKVTACEILLGELMVHYFSFNDGVPQRHMIREIFH